MALTKYCWLLFGLTVLVGCGDAGPETARVRGQVTFDGVPLTSCIVHFVPQSGPAASSPIAEDGTFELSTRSDRDGAVLGTHRIYLTAPPTDLGDYSLDDYAANKPPPGGSSKPLFPKKYLSPATSGLSAEVESGSNQVDLKLSSDG